jgi:hypothetical protein
MGSSGDFGRRSIVVPEDLGFGETPPQMVEPVFVPRVVVNGTHVSVKGGLVLIDGWEDVTAPTHSEKRCVGRGAMSVSTARALAEQILRKIKAA